MSLSPLYSTPSINLRVRMQNGPPPIFLSASTWSRIARCLSGLYNLTLRNSKNEIEFHLLGPRNCTLARSFLLLSLRVQVSTHFYSCQIVKLLSPCFKTGDSKEFNDNGNWPRGAFAQDDFSNKTSKLKFETSLSQSSPSTASTWSISHSTVNS